MPLFWHGYDVTRDIENQIYGGSITYGIGSYKGASLLLRVTKLTCLVWAVQNFEQRGLGIIF
jgi:hypothetical protein